MKRIIFSSLIAAVLISSCNKNDLNEDRIWVAKTPETALVRFVHAYTALTPTLATPQNGPRVDFFINNVKMNSAPMSYPDFYPNTVGGGAFAQAPSGNVNIKVVFNRPAGGGLPSDTIVNGMYTLGPNVSHSIVLVDTFPNPTPFSPILMVIQESVSMPAYGKFKLRFMNMIPTNELYEIYNSTSATVLTPPIAFKNLSDWIELPSASATQIYQLRVVGSTTAIASTPSTAIYSNLRSYTLWARGNNPAPVVGAGVRSRARALTLMTTQ